MSKEFILEKLEDPIKLLREGELLILTEAKQFLEIHIPENSRDLKTQAQIYLTNNTNHQLKLNNLSTQLNYTASKVSLNIAKASYVEREMLMSEGFRSAGERDEMRFRDSKIRNMQEQYNALKNIAQHVETIEWLLKSKAKMLTG